MSRDAERDRAPKRSADRYEAGVGSAEARERARSSIAASNKRSRRMERVRRVRARAELRGPIAWHNLGWYLMLLTIAMSLLGIYAISLSGGIDNISGRLSTQSLVNKQAVFLVVAVTGAVFIALLRTRHLVYAAWPLAITALALLVFVLLPFAPPALVTPRNGARRWISLVVIDFQPSEIAKVAFVLVTAVYIRFRSSHRSFIGLLTPAFIAFVPMALILVEPDLGTAVLFMPALIAMLIAAGAKLKHLAITVGAGVVFATTVATISLVAAEQDKYPLLRPHQVVRIQAVIDQIKGDERFIQDRGFQGYKARMLAGSGGTAGHAEAKSRALIEYSRLPEGHNDMIYAVVVNRFGMIGAVALIGAYIAWFIIALVIAGLSKDPFGRIVVVGLASMVLVQASVNMGMTLGILPITGMTLPFISYGGSSLVSAYLAAGFCLHVALRREGRLWRRSFEFDND